MAGLFEFSIKTSIGRYGVLVGSGVVKHAIQQPDSHCVIDSMLPAMHPHLSETVNIPLQALESTKTLESVGMVIERLRGLGAHRQSHLVAIGGGIVQDISTFTASSYMRGIAWTYCPSTLLGMVDSCIGGKSSLNVGRYKNIAGNFYPPQRVLIDTDFCHTLTATQQVEGLFEAVKICYASSGDAFDRYLDLMSATDPLRAQYDFAPVIQLSLQTKKAFIEEDEFDQGVRLLLNFGHTFGHAIEGASDFGISHGIAVGLGMLAALHFSQTQGLVSEMHPRVAALKQYIYSLLAITPDLTQRLAELSLDKAMACFMSDKKHTKDTLTLILFDITGHLVRHRISSTAKILTSIRDAFAHLKNLAHEIQ